MRRVILQFSALLLLLYLPCEGNALTYWDYFKKENRFQGPAIRLGCGIAFMADRDLASNYGTGQSAFFDYNAIRLRYGTIGLDCYGRLTAKLFRATNKTIDKNEYAVSEHHLLISGVDTGIRLKTYNYFLGRSFSLYLSAAPRFIYSRTMYSNRDESYGVDKNFFSIGIVGGTGFEIALYRNTGFFMEYSYGYTPVSESEANTEGHTLYAGVTFLTPIH